MAVSKPSPTPPSSSPSITSESRIHLRIEPSELWSFYNQICPDLPQEICKKLENVFKGYIETKSFLDFKIGVLQLIHDQPKVVFHFKTMLRAILGENEYLDQVLVRLLPDTNILEYFNLLYYLRLYKQKLFTFTQFKNQVEMYFLKHPDLWENFDENFDNEEKYETSDKEGDGNPDETLEEKATDEEGDENLANELKDKTTDDGGTKNLPNELKNETTDKEGDENIPNELKEKTTDGGGTKSNEADASPMSKKQKI